MNTRIYSVVWLLLLGVACSAYAQSNKVERQRQLEPTIKTFEEADKTNPPAKGAVLFIGSSSIALWKSLREDFPKARVINISIKPSPARWHLRDKVREANRLIKDFTEHDRRLGYIDVFSPMLGKDGEPRPELFVEDSLHMNDAGYTLWRSTLAPYIR